MIGERSHPENSGYRTDTCASPALGREGNKLLLNKLLLQNGRGLDHLLGEAVNGSHADECKSIGLVSKVDINMSGGSGQEYNLESLFLTERFGWFEGAIKPGSGVNV